jgi:hypothetical protein
MSFRDSELQGQGTSFTEFKSSPNNYDGAAMMMMVVMVPTMMVRLRVSRSRDESEESKCHYLLHAHWMPALLGRAALHLFLALFCGDHRLPTYMHP